MGTGSFLGVKWLGRGVDHPSTPSAEVKERVELYLYSPCCPSWPVPVSTLPLPLIYNYLLVLLTDQIIWQHVMIKIGHLYAISQHKK